MLLLVIERPMCMMDPSIHTNCWCFLPQKTITLIRLPNCLYADMVMANFHMQTEMYHQYNWEIVYDEPKLPSPTLRIDLGEFYDYYYGVNEVKDALSTHFLFH